MNQFKEYLPAFFAHAESDLAVVDFDTTEDLLKLDWFTRDRGKRFSHFSKSERHILAIYEGGLEWYVVGSVKYPDLVNFSEWDGGKRRAQLTDGRYVVLDGKDVISVCGDEIVTKEHGVARAVNPSEWHNHGPKWE